MKIKHPHKYIRTMFVTGLTGEIPALEIRIDYTGQASSGPAIALDDEVIPFIVKAVNHYDELVAVAKLLVEEAEAFGFDSINVNCYGEAKALLIKLEESK